MMGKAMRNRGRAVTGWWVTGRMEEYQNEVTLHLMLEEDSRRVRIARKGKNE
jgi:hypothetical protein